MIEPTEKECQEAIDYYFHNGEIYKLTCDDLKHTKTLVNAVAGNVLHQDLIWRDDEWNEREEE